ncbi:unnamed protein product [Caenorhabditis angaria]|uniref:Uncharacterized protein n=1 Tax=Caenorhabditis angaria TaxID=860376 RepID=A0A9P1J0G9_9PELO|nr:unnamed protein product [Caenorhabditis angaria]
MHGEKNEEIPFLNTNKMGITKGPKTISDAINRFLNNTTAHGLPRISNARNHEGKVFWVIVWVVFFSVFGIQAILLYTKFQQKHPSTNVKIG